MIRPRLAALLLRAGRLLPALAAFAAAAPALARVGGGDTYSGSHHSSGGGSSDGGDSDFVFFLVWLLFRHPAIGIPVAIIVAVVWFMGKRSGGASRAGWETAPAGRSAYAPGLRRPAGAELERLRRFDPAFSRVLFEDFLYALYARVHEARGNGALDPLSAYLSPAALEVVRRAGAGLSEVRGIVIGAMHLSQVRGVDAGSPAVSVTVGFESNYTEVQGPVPSPPRGPAVQGKAQTYYAVERWTLVRRREAQSRPPERARRIGCPSCGAPLEAIRGEVCSYCNKVVNTGEFDWRVEAIELLGKEERPPAIATSVEEEGNELPTLVSPGAEEGIARITANDPQFSMPLFRARAEMVFGELQAAWSSRDWTRSRPYVSDNLFQMQLYWIETFERLKIRNVLEQLEILDVQLAAVQSDAYYDVITVRIIARCLDYYRAEDGRILSGSARSPRRFTEYWTFIRGRGKGGPPKAEKRCPNCGAPVQINQAGICDYCKAKVTSGEFDWILSRIEQDEAYRG